MAMSGCSTCAAVTAPRRLNSSCTEKTKCTRRPLRSRHQLPRDFDDDRAAGTVVDRGAGDAVRRELDPMRPIDDGGADVDAGGQHLVPAGEAGIDVEVLVRDDLVFLLRRRRVVALVGDDARPVAARRRRRSALPAMAARAPARRPAARPAGSHRLDLAHDEAELVHMREQHDRRRARVALERGDQIAEPVGARRQPEGLAAGRRGAGAPCPRSRTGRG